MGNEGNGQVVGQNGTSHDIRAGDLVVLHVPDIPLIHQTQARVIQMAEWGAHVEARTATGQYRAGWGEMVRCIAGHKPISPKVSGYTGDVCDQCGGCRMRRNGACLICEDCGTTSGCS